MHLIRIQKNSNEKKKTKYDRLILYRCLSTAVKIGKARREFFERECNKQKLILLYQIICFYSDIELNIKRIYKR